MSNYKGVYVDRFKSTLAYNRETSKGYYSTVRGAVYFKEYSDCGRWSCLSDEFTYVATTAFLDWVVT